MARKSEGDAWAVMWWSYVRERWMWALNAPLFITRVDARDWIVRNRRTSHCQPVRVQMALTKRQASGGS